MKLLRLHLLAFGPFTDRVLDFGSARQGNGLVLVHGLNEAGKSSTLRAMADLRFGIPAQSRDNFVHAHADMRIGGEFIDRDGGLHGFVRRKGRGGTLLRADFSGGSGAVVVGDPVPAEVEALLTGGLTREEYESMFSLDHTRLRKGGKALLEGEGDVGAALFEASAGVRSIPQVLTRLDDSARRFFMPGARGKNARINQALATYEERNAEFKKSLVRPMQWAELFRQHQTAAEALAALERSRRASQASLLQVKELRAVAPLIATLDAALASLAELDSVRMLAPDAAAMRAAAESGLFDALHNAREATTEAERHRMVLETLLPDAAVLSAGAAIQRLMAAAETVDPQRHEIVEARGEVERETRLLDDIAAQIAPGRAVSDVVAQAPSRTVRAAIEAAVRQFESARQAFDQHDDLGRQEAAASDVQAEPLPSAESRTALRIAQAEVARNDSTLQKLKTLPGSIRTAERQADAALAALGLADASALARVRPLLPSQIDLALKEEGASTVRRDGLALRVDDISTALADAAGRQEKLLADGAPATRDDVRAARDRREIGWALVRDTYIERTVPARDLFSTDNDGFAAGRALPLAYVDAVQEADRLVDELAGDTARSSALQAVKREIANLERDRAALVQQLADIAAADSRRTEDWQRLLTENNLPPLPPAAMREWEVLVPKAQGALDQRQALRDELEETLVAERTLADALADALAQALANATPAVGGAAPSDGASLPMLAAMAAALEESFRQREKAADAARGEQVQRERATRLHLARREVLSAALEAASVSLVVHLTALGLPRDAGVGVARARLAEFDELVSAQARLTAAEASELRARKALALLSETVGVVMADIGEKAPGDVRAGIDALAARLAAAQVVERRRTLARQAADNAAESLVAHSKTVARHEATLAALCVAAGVASAALLPEAEENSRRKREAVHEIDRSRNHLAQVTSRDLDELRRSLEGWDVARMDAEERALAQGEAQTETALQSARVAEESTRRALDAIDGSDIAANAREGMEQAAARVRADMAPWIRSRLAHALLAEALKRFRDRAQGPMLQAATTYFGAMTHGEFDRLLSDDSGKEPALVAQRRNGTRIRVEEMSEGTLDQLYLALRLAALDIRRSAGVDLPVVFDDVLMTSDEGRSGAMLEALAAFSRGTHGMPGSQVIVFTHHRHLVDVAQRHLAAEGLAVVGI
ncbi:AAA family ATPase [Variovorax sp. RHLX14]|uniref:ATP-binding protein n=1 Tax=Variovorax sp. RHLX14 TaxID=1259731 RepID=UPI003F481F61